jgi:hypothetical protein
MRRREGRMKKASDALKAIGFFAVVAVRFQTQISQQQFLNQQHC